MEFKQLNKYLWDYVSNKLCLEEYAFDFEIVYSDELHDVNNQPICGRIRAYPIRENYFFDIEFNENLDLKTYIKTFFHEMTHLYQYVIGDLVDINYEETVWNNKKYFILNDDYYDLPWEKEAFDNEDFMYEEFMKLIKLSNPILLKDIKKFIKEKKIIADICYEV